MAAKLFYRSKVSEAVVLIIQPYIETRALSCESRRQRSPCNIAAYMNDHYNCTILLEQLAKIACMETTKLKKSFHQVCECTITKYIRQRRLSQGKNLLATTDFLLNKSP